MPDYITPADISALNSAVVSNEAYGAAKRGAEGILERISASRESAGLSDSDIFHAISRGANNKSGLHWLTKLMGTLTEYLGSWGTLVLIGVSFVATLIMLKQNAKHIWTTITTFMTKHPLVTAALGAAGGFGLSYLMKDDVDDAADAIIDITIATLPAPVALLVRKTSSAIAGSRLQGVNTASGASTEGYDVTDTTDPRNYELNEAGEYVPASWSNFPGATATNRLTGKDAYTRDAYTRDAYGKRRMRKDTFSGNIGV